MADNATAALDSGRSSEPEPGPLGEPVDFDVRGLGRRLPRTEAPEGWIKKIERPREGKVWVGFFHLWTTDLNGRRVRQKKEKTLGPASMPKHEAQKRVADYISEYTGRLSRQGKARGGCVPRLSLCAPDVAVDQHSYLTLAGARWLWFSRLWSLL